MASDTRQSAMAFSWRMLWRDWRGGELRILAAALLIAVTSVTAVGFFIDRVDRGRNRCRQDGDQDDGQSPLFNQHVRFDQANGRQCVYQQREFERDPDPEHQAGNKIIVGLRAQLGFDAHKIQ